MLFHTLVLLVALWQAVSATTSNCFEFGVGPQGHCNVAPDSTARFQAYMVLDTTDGNCTFDGAVYMHIRYPDLAGEMHNLSALNNPQQATTENQVSGMVPFNFQVAYSDIGTQALTMIIGATAASFSKTYSTSVSYMNARKPTITSVQGTITVTTNSHATSIKTMIMPVITHKIVTPVSQPTATQIGFWTKTKSAPLVTVTALVPQDVYTSTRFSQMVVTSTLGCGVRSSSALRFMPRVAALSFSPPYCAQPVTTSVTTGVSMVTVTSTWTETSTILSLRTTTSTVTASTTLCKKCTGTKFVTLAPSTVTSYVKASRSTIFTTVPSVIQKFVKPSGNACSSLSSSTAMSFINVRIGFPTPGTKSSTIISKYSTSTFFAPSSPTTTAMVASHPPPPAAASSSSFTPTSSATTTVTVVWFAPPPTETSSSTPISSASSSSTTATVMVTSHAPPPAAAAGGLTTTSSSTTTTATVAWHAPPPSETITSTSASIVSTSTAPQNSQVTSNPLITFSPTPFSTSYGSSSLSTSSGSTHIFFQQHIYSADKRSLAFGFFVPAFYQHGI
ncbi:hypothetical protein MBLNU459_g0504t1 [Dothideomycetes sp. NU459]